MRDNTTDNLLLELRRLFNRSAWAELDRHRLMLSDYLEDLGRADEAESLRSDHWYLLKGEGQGWPPICCIVGEYVPGTARGIYMDSAWIAAAQAAAEMEAKRGSCEETEATLRAHALAWQAGLVSASEVVQLQEDL